ncbi:hypothetical protein [Methanococcus maripaludis]|uniref:Uncharacterized protein n=2 Tax=Methanococcus maripaludis TaxID=39152 RepID=A0A7J9PFL1_METMI|nr:hypothetical protein [Methanococcus maripaludis]MBA2862043.1 hypothetical protein [Methanococcus maripaludis]
MQAVNICSNHDYLEKNHLKLILNGLETGFIAMREFRETLEKPDDEDIIYRKLCIDIADDNRIIFNEFQKIHISELNYEESKVLKDGYLKLDRFIAGYVIKEDQIMDEIKKGNLIGYSKDVEEYYVLYCNEF